jgi:L-2-hydroxyglutarate oxidase
VERSDFLIIGGGIVGLTLALELRRRHPSASVVVLEKEDRVGAHSSGRNSGVLHAGFYYTADSLKARLCREGNRRMTEFCLNRGLRIRRTGKLVVTRSEAELPMLEELLRRGAANGVEVSRVTEEEARELEPLARTVQVALHSPTTSSVEPSEVVSAFLSECRNRGVEVRCGEAYLGMSRGVVRTSVGRREAGFVLNAAGIHADRVARDFGFGEQFTMLPFKGLYLYGDSGAPPLRMQVYPVPDLRQPFLGLHFTVTVDGRVKIGPTATPALGREQYGMLDPVTLRELAEILGWEARLFMGNDFGFRELALLEARKILRGQLVKMAGDMVRGVRPDNFREWGRPGIRAQLFNVRTRRLEMDFVYEGDHRSLHVLNAVSPAFTCALAFSEYLVDEVERMAA